MVLLIILAIVLIVILGSLKQINEYERGVKFTAGKFTKIMLPGWRIVLPIFQSYKKVDIRTKVDDVPEQEAITKDNVSVKINAVIYYKVFDASLAVLEVEDFYYATAQLAQTTMRNIVGSVTLDELLCEREKVSSQIKEIIDKNPTITMLVGLQGSGKTTTIGKLANLLRKKHSKKPLLVACDVYRPAAIDQLKQLGKELNIEDKKLLKY